MKSYLYIEKSNTEWKKRGSLNFITKNKSKNNKAQVVVTNETLDDKDDKLIGKECELHGHYITRTKIGNNYYYSTLDAVNFF
jgi:hypothetical protein